MSKHQVGRLGVVGRENEVVALEPINRTNISAIIFERILFTIVAGNWREGDRIPPERELCQQLGVARPSLREALKALELIGMLESKIGDGTFVSSRLNFLSKPVLWAIVGSQTTDVQEIMESRMVIEVELAGFASQRAVQTDLDQMQAAIDALREGLHRRESVWEADMRFHMALAQSARNQILSNALMMIRNLLKQVILETLRVPLIPELAVKQHTSILEAIASRDKVAARDRMRIHIEQVAGVITQIKAAISHLPRNSAQTDLGPYQFMEVGRSQP